MSNIFDSTHEKSFISRLQTYQEYKDILRGKIYHCCTLNIIQNVTSNNCEYFSLEKTQHLY